MFTPDYSKCHISDILTFKCGVPLVANKFFGLVSDGTFKDLLNSSEDYSDSEKNFILCTELGIEVDYEDLFIHEEYLVESVCLYIKLKDYLANKKWIINMIDYIKYYFEWEDRTEKIEFVRNKIKDIEVEYSNKLFSISISDEDDCIVVKIMTNENHRRESYLLIANSLQCNDPDVSSAISKMLNDNKRISYSNYNFLFGFIGGNPFIRHEYIYDIEDKESEKIKAQGNSRDEVYYLLQAEPKLSVKSIHSEKGSLIEKVLSLTIYENDLYGLISHLSCEFNDNLHAKNIDDCINQYDTIYFESEDFEDMHEGRVFCFENNLYKIEVKYDSRYINITFGFTKEMESYRLISRFSTDHYYLDEECKRVVNRILLECSGLK